MKVKTKYGNLTYCSNIHPGESWKDHFLELKTYLPKIKSQVSPDHPFAIGLRLSDEASLSLLEADHLSEWKEWLKKESMYVISINGFPFGGFHSDVVKENVYKPDWSTRTRYEYTKRLFSILHELLPEGEEGGVSTPPLSYFYFDSNQIDSNQRKEKCTQNIIQTLVDLIRFKMEFGRVLHLDLEPEPDGLIGTFANFIQWYEDQLIPQAFTILNREFGFQKSNAIIQIKEHIRLCLDVCHLAVTHEINELLLTELKRTGIKVGRIQVSSALKVKFTEPTESILEVLRPFDEKKYLHQVVAIQNDGSKISYRDLGEAIANGVSFGDEWRIHFHVPIFLESYGSLFSTQEELSYVLEEHKKFPFTNILEIETYTWNVLPESLQMSMESSIIREIDWVKKTFGIS
jgi:hypothetical protein